VYVCLSVRFLFMLLSAGASQNEPPPELQQLALNFLATFLLVTLQNNDRRFDLHGALYTAFHYQQHPFKEPFTPR